MDGRHMLKYHVAIPLGIFAALLVVGIPVSTAFYVGMMSGCVSMMFMMMGGMGRHEHHDEPREAAPRTTPDARSVGRGRRSGA